MRINRKIKSERLLRAIALLGVVIFAATTHVLNAQEQPALDIYKSMLRWGRPAPGSRSEEITLRLAELYALRGNDLNFSKRNLTSLIEEAFPRRLGRLFPFRTSANIAPDFFFENFAPIGFLAGELNERVPPILSETKTADWLELRSRQPIDSLRELAPQTTLQQGLRALALQTPWSAEVFSTLWEENLEAAIDIIEFGGLNCKKAHTTATTSAKTVASQMNPALPPHFRCSKPTGRRDPSAGIPKQLPRKLGPLNADTPALAASSSQGSATCLPAGRLQSQTLELIGDEKAGHCFLWRASLDERFHQRAMTSTLICLNAKYKSFQRTRFNNVVAIIPSTRADQMNIIEAEDGLLTSYRLSLATLSVKKNEISASSGQNIRNFQFPLARTGLYVCKSPSSTSKTLAPFASPMISASHLEWIYLDDAVYSGLRQERPETDVAWRLREVREGVIDAERLSWSQLKYDHPSILAEPSITCATYRSVDSNCAMRIVQTALQISEEYLKGEFETQVIDLQTQLSVVTLMGRSLEKVTETLPDWALHDESRALLSFYTQKADTLSKKLEANGIANITISPSQSKLTQPKYLDINKNSQDYLAIRNKIFSASDFWATLKQKPM